MNSYIGLDKCPPFISAEFRPLGTPRRSPDNGSARRAVTISRQSGCGAQAVADKLVECLEAQAPTPGCPWTVFDRNLVAQVLEDHGLPRRFARFMPEDRVSEVADVMDEMLGAHPPASVLAERTAETMLRLAERGNVILIGRGANIVTSKCMHVLHVRLVASLEKRIEHLQQLQGIGKAAARELIRKEDRGRQRYLKKYFGKDHDDPLQYHLVINTDLVPYDQAARMIAEAVLTGLHRKPLERVGDGSATRSAEAVA